LNVQQQFCKRLVFNRAILQAGLDIAGLTHLIEFACLGVDMTAITVQMVGTRTNTFRAAHFALNAGACRPHKLKIDVSLTWLKGDFFERERPPALFVSRPNGRPFSVPIRCRAEQLVVLIAREARHLWHCRQRHQPHDTGRSHEREIDADEHAAAMIDLFHRSNAEAVARGHEERLILAGPLPTMLLTPGTRSAPIGNSS
jgi:hypothetical protein